jgi:hypothetical protein
MRHAMNIEDSVHEKLSHIGGGKWVLKSIEMSISRKTINETHDD